MPTTHLSIDNCRNYIEECLFGPPVEPGGRPGGEAGSVGVELECFPVVFNTEEKIFPAKLYDNENSLTETLIRFSEKKEGKARYSDHNLEGELQNPIVTAIDFPDGSSFQFEPGAQVEISTAPCQNIESVSEKINYLQEIFHEISRQSNFHFVQVGTHPWFGADAIGMQLNKNRYNTMARYFDRINDYGRQMMLQTCSLQVNLDAGDDWDTRSKRFVAANLIAPFASAIFANSSIIAGKASGYKSFRSYIWQHLDKTRTGVLNMEQLSKGFSKDSIIDAYLQFALNAPVIYIEELGSEVFGKDITFEYWMSHSIRGIAPSIGHFKNHLSLLFPEVRLKGYLELRSVDAPPAEWQMVPVLFYCGLLYSNLHLEKTLEMLVPFSSQLPVLMEKATMGLDSDEIFMTAKKLVVLSIDGFAFLPEAFKGQQSIDSIISFLERFTIQRKTFADEFLENFSNNKKITSQK